MYSSIPVLYTPFLVFDIPYLSICATLMSSLLFLWCFCLFCSFSVPCFLSMNLASFRITLSLALKVELSVNWLFYCFWARICMTNTHTFSRKLMLKQLMFIIWSLILGIECRWIWTLKCACDTSFINLSPEVKVNFVYVN